jgi:hypothetical protein
VISIVLGCDACPRKLEFPVSQLLDEGSGVNFWTWPDHQAFSLEQLRMPGAWRCRVHPDGRTILVECPDHSREEPHPRG